jgi:hypothetical protein
LNRSALRKILERAADDGNIDKPVNPHNFRRSCATRLASKGWNEFQLRLFFGWAKNSREPSRYVNMATNTIREKAALEAGYSVQGEEIKPTVKKCWRCGNYGKPDGHCQVCGTDLRIPITEVIKSEMERKSREEIIDMASKHLPEIETMLRLLEDKEFQHFVEEFKKSRTMKLKVSIPVMYTNGGCKVVNSGSPRSGETPNGDEMRIRSPKCESLWKYVKKNNSKKENGG